MQWLVIIHKRNGNLSIKTREQRNIDLKHFFHFRWIVPTRVIKVCNSEDEAKQAVERIKNGEEIIKTTWQ